MLVAVIDFLARNAAALDRTDFDHWAEDFVEDCTYRIVSMENHQLGYDMPLMLMKNKNMILDRILSLREANIFNIHRDSHILGLPVVEKKNDRIQVETPITVFQTNQDGVASLFCVGRYVDKIVETKAGLKLKSRDVMVENFGIIRLLSTPL